MSESPAESGVTPIAEPAEDVITDLFASLRTPDAASPPAAAAETPAVVAATNGEVGTHVEAASATTEPMDLEPAAPDADEAAGDEFAEREAALLPLTNRALRVVKKQILDFQNVMLEATKADPDGWRADTEEYRLALDPHVQALVDEAHQTAGGEGAADIAIEFGAALGGSVNAAADTMTGSGYRETSASLGRVFRSWRSDEAERRLIELATAAYLAATATRTSS